MTATPAPQRFDLTLHTATDQRWEFQHLAEDGTPIVPTAAQAQIRARPGGEHWATLACAVDPTSGIITVTASRTATSGESWDRRAEGVWDLLVDQGSERIRLLEGRVTVSQEVTSWS